MPKDEKSLNAARVAFLADRMAILLVICKSRTGDWTPFCRDAMYDADESLGVQVREWQEYTTAKDIIRNMLRKFDNEHINLQERQQGKVAGNDQGG